MIRAAIALGALAIAGACEARSGEPFASAVVEHALGDGGGYGEEALPDVVLGPPKGRGAGQGSLDVLSLGLHGSIVLELGVDVIDGDGPDLLVFENAFVGFGEPGEVSASLDGESWATFACDGEEGCAGFAPVHANADDNELDPTDPDEAGGDAFDLADVGLARARYVRVVDAAERAVGAGGMAGFDLDAVAVVNAAP